MNLLRLITAIVAALPLHGIADTPALPPAAPEVVGLRADKLADITRQLRRDVDNELLPGAVLLIARHGKLAYFEAVGSLHPAARTPMARDAIFRIESMTKPITAVAAMMLVEDGKLALDDPVARHVPAFANVKVATESAENGGRMELRKPQRVMTVRDLMRHTAGLDYGYIAPRSERTRLVGEALRSIARDPSNEEYANALAQAPLAAEPGTAWNYSNATDVLGRVVEVAAGQKLSVFMRERIFEPLQMRDTAFHVADAAKHARVAEPFERERGPWPGGAANDPRVARRFEAGGYALTSTALDYARFAQMLLNGGELDGKRLLRAQTVALMTTDQSAGMRRGASYPPGEAYGFGFGFAVRTRGPEAAPPGAVGDYGWGGAGGTYFWVDPQHRLLVVLMMQSTHQRLPYRTWLRQMVYEALIR